MVIVFDRLFLHLALMIMYFAFFKKKNYYLEWSLLGSWWEDAFLLFSCRWSTSFLSCPGLLDLYFVTKRKKKCPLFPGEMCVSSVTGLPQSQDFTSMQECEEWWGSKFMKNPWCPHTDPTVRCSAVLLSPELAWMGSGGVVGIAQQYFCNCFSSSISGCHTLAALPPYLCSCHWDQLQCVSQFLRYLLLQFFQGPAASSGRVRGGSQAPWFSILPGNGGC